jgi:hypothetical protein
MSKEKSLRIDAKCVNWQGEVYTITVGGRKRLFLC